MLLYSVPRLPTCLYVAADSNLLSRIIGSMDVKLQNPRRLSRCENRDQRLWNGCVYYSYGVDWDSTLVYVMQLNVSGIVNGPLPRCIP